MPIHSTRFKLLITASSILLLHLFISLSVLEAIHGALCTLLVNNTAVKLILPKKIGFGFLRVDRPATRVVTSVDGERRSARGKVLGGYGLGIYVEHRRDDTQKMLLLRSWTRSIIAAMSRGF